MRRELRPVLIIVMLDAVGIGIFFPTMPILLHSLLHRGDVARPYGYLLSVYAAAMFLASPLLGRLSDRFGRRPVLLVSLLGTSFDNLVMALAPTLPIMYLGRILAGFAGANLTVANAYISDITSQENRAKAFGRLNASFGVGFIAGPILGSVVGAHSLRAPFYLAAALNLVGTVVCFYFLAESRSPQPLFSPKGLALNPVASLLALSKFRGMSRLLYVFCTMAVVGQIPGVLWVLYGINRFHWTQAIVALSFAVFGLLHALFQTFLPETAQRKLGQEGTVKVAMIIDCLAFSIFSVLRTSGAAFKTLPLLALGGTAEPAVQSMLTGGVSEVRQGELQGVLTSLTSLIAIIGPVAVTNLYALLRQDIPRYPGAIWLVTVFLYLPCILIRQSQRRREVTLL